MEGQLETVFVDGQELVLAGWGGYGQLVCLEGVAEKLAVEVPEHAALTVLVSDFEDDLALCGAAVLRRVDDGLVAGVHPLHGALCVGPAFG